MEQLKRRTFLSLLLGAGAAATCGMSTSSPAEAQTAADVATAVPTDAAEAVTEVESALEPDQFYIVRRRRFRRRVFYVRPRRRIYYARRRRVYFVRRRPRRFYRVRRFRRW